MDWKDQLDALRNSGSLAEPEPEKEEEKAEPSQSKLTVQKSPLNVVIDRKGRKGKTATIIEGLEASDEEVEELAAVLKKRLGTGGSVRDGEILVQGDKKSEIVKILKDLNYKVK